jgi:glyoxylase-like metal-dependent hydrolase (beta-lactamase superfamily II)
MVQVTGVLQKEAWDRQVMPPVEQVRPGLWSIPVPIPNNPLRYVLVYAFELDSGLTIVDAGWNTDDAWSALNAGLVEAGGSISDVQSVLVTHIHPDHYGLAGRVRDESGAWIGLHPDDAAMLQGRYVDVDELLGKMHDLLEFAGVPETTLPDLNMASMMIRDQVAMAEPDVFFEDGEEVDVPGWDLRTVWTPGHSPGHVCFYSEQHRLLLSGDHVLPRITPNIGVHTQQIPNPLGDFLESLLKVQNLDVEEVLPAHEYRFSGLKGRLDEIIVHHAERLAEIELLLTKNPGMTAWDRSSSSCNAQLSERRSLTWCSSRSTNGFEQKETDPAGTTWRTRKRPEPRSPVTVTVRHCEHRAHNSFSSGPFLPVASVWVTTTLFRRR